MIRLCDLSEIPEDGSNGFAVALDGKETGVMAIRRDGQVFAYENSCPHLGVPLDFEPGKFLDSDNQYIICSTHGAQFQIADGYCVSGPCNGDSLNALNVTLDGTDVFISKP